MAKQRLIKVKLQGLLHSPESLFAVAGFLKSRRGRKLLKRVARSPEGRDLIRAIKNEPGGKTLLKALFRDKSKKEASKLRGKTFKP